MTVRAEEASAALKVEWAKTQARALRYREEEELVIEEMRRVITYLTSKAHWWRNSSVGEGSNKSVRRGCKAYANRQAYIPSNCALSSQRCGPEDLDICRWTIVCYEKLTVYNPR